MKRPPAESPKEKIEGLGQGWAMLSKGAAVFVAIVTTFLLPPPKNLAASGAGGVQPRPFAVFLVAVALGFLLLLMNRWKAAKNAVRWVTLSGCLLILTVALTFVYSDALTSATTMYDGERVIVGSVYTPAATGYLRTHPSVSREQLLMDSAGSVEDVWTADSIAANARLILALYLSVFLGAATAVMTLVHAIERDNVPRRKPRAKAVSST